jgi:hypothetical protein
MIPYLPGTNQRNSPLGRRLATALAWATVFGLAGKGKLSGADFPQAEITNGQLHVKLYLPDAQERILPRSLRPASRVSFFISLRALMVLVMLSDSMSRKIESAKDHYETCS